MNVKDRPARLFLVAVAMWALSIALWGPVAQWVPPALRAVFSIPVAALCLVAAIRADRASLLAGLAAAAGFGAWNVLRIILTDYPPRTVIAGVTANGVITVAALVIGSYVDAGGEDDD